MANAIAIALDRAHVAEMSCIAGVGGDVPALVRTATSGRPIVALDGCPLQCVRASLGRHGVSPELHVDLSDLGVKKRKGVDFDLDEAEQALSRVRSAIDRTFAPSAGGLTDAPVIDGTRVAPLALRAHREAS